MLTAPVPHVDYDRYRASILDNLALPPAQWTFKSDPRYRQILEHVTQAQAFEFLGYARQEFVDIWDRVIELVPAIVQDNDRFGQPVRELALFGMCSPSNMRYLYHALLTLRHIDALGQDQVHIVELGGGYGGLALYVHRLRSLFNTRVLTYTIVDVPEACAMQAAMAAAINVPLRAVNGLDADDLATATCWAKERCFFVSAYGFAEFRKPFQDWYAERLIKHCQHGFLVWNFHPYWNNPVYQFVPQQLHLEDERPLTSPGNLFVTF